MGNIKTMTESQRTAIEFIIENPSEENYTSYHFSEWRDSLGIIHDNVDENVSTWRKNYKIMLDYLKEQLAG